MGVSWGYHEGTMGVSWGYHGGNLGISWGIMEILWDDHGVVMRSIIRVS